MAFHPPSEFNANRVNSGDSVCEALTKVFRQVNLLADNVAAERNEDGSFTAGFIAKICATGCAGGGGDTNTSTPDPSASTSIYMASRFLSGGVFRGRLFFIESGGWTYTTINGNMDQVILGMAIRPSDGVAFVVYVDQTNDSSPYPLRMGTLNLTTGAITYIATINSGGSDWSTLGADDQYALEFKADGTLYLGTWSASPVSNLYTVNLATAAITAVGVDVQMDSGANSFLVYSMSYDSGGTLYALGFDCTTNRYITASINTTPNPAFGNALLATEECEILQVASVPTVNNQIWMGLVNKGGEKFIWTRGTADIYQVADGSGCVSPFVQKMTGAPSMAQVTAVAGVPS